MFRKAVSGMTTVNLESLPVLYKGSEQYLNIEKAGVRMLKRDVYAKELKL